MDHESLPLAGSDSTRCSLDSPEQVIDSSEYTGRATATTTGSADGTGLPAGERSRTLLMVSRYVGPGAPAAPASGTRSGSTRSSVTLVPSSESFADFTFV